jgi:ribonuclease J
MPDHKLRVIPLGGVGEIGKNMTLFEYNNEAIIIDAGIMFPENDMLGIDYIIPDYQYILDNRSRLKIHALLVTHGHEDHTGAIPYFLRDVPVPVYATSLTEGLIHIKLKNHKMKDHPTHVFKAGDTLKFGPFTVESFHMTHSIPDCVGFGIHTPVGLIMHSGDYKFDQTPTDGWPTDFARIASLSQKGVLALFADSTNADHAGWTPSETVIDDAFDQVFSAAPGRIIVATFASLISRIQQVANAADAYGRKMAVAGYSMTENIKIARRLGYLEIPDGMLISVEESKQMPPEEVVIMATGTQGEPSAVLGRLAYGSHRQLVIQENDTVVMSAHPIPGNEEVVYRITNKLLQAGAEVIYDPKARVHVSGHASQEEIKLLINLVRPRFLIPVHGELRHLHAHADLAFDCGIPAENIAVIENGTMLEFGENTMAVGERVPGGYVFVDGAGVGDIGPAVLRDREALGRDGFVTIIGIIDGKTNTLIEEPEIISRGFVYLGSSDDLFDATRKLVRELTPTATKKSREQQIQNAVGKLFYTETKRRPMIFVHLHEIQ